MKSLEWAGEKLALLPEKAIWWPRRKTLFIADPHFGKASTFRHAGIPVPETSHDDDIATLDRISRERKARHLVILGDFFHAKTGRTSAVMEAIEAWLRCRKRLEIMLVAGNHDRHAGAPPPEWSFHCVTGPLSLPPFLCVHEPKNIPGSHVLAGHSHPSFYLQDSAGVGCRFPCFHFGLRLAVLPAFGTFTGTHAIKAAAGDRVFVTVSERVIDVSAIAGNRVRK